MAWEFLAKEKDAATLEVDLVIRDIRYREARFSYDSSLFIHIPSRDFERLSRLGTIDRFSSLDDFAEHFFDNLPSDDVSIEVEEPDPYDLGLKDWNKGDCLYMQGETVETTIEEMLKKTGVRNVGICDVVVKGVYEHKLFDKVYVADRINSGGVLVGGQFMGQLEDLSMGGFEGLGFAIKGIISD